MSTRTKVSKFKKVIRNPNGKGYVVKVETLVYNFDPILREWDRKPTETTTYEPMTEKDGSKELKLQVIEKREAINPNTLEPMQANFLRTITLKIDDDMPSVFLKSANNRPILSDVVSGMSREISMIELWRGMTGLKCIIGKAKRISEEKLKAISKELYPYPIQLIGSGQNLDVRLVLYSS